jgi:hypothetical protein
MGWSWVVRGDILVPRRPWKQMGRRGGVLEMREYARKITTIMRIRMVPNMGLWGSILDHF